LLDAIPTDRRHSSGGRGQLERGTNSGSAPTAPELLVRAPREWANDIADVQDLLARAGSARTTATWPEHPAFGKLSKRAWGVLIYRHMDHHLRQFGA
jgi:hypothetical protein